VLKIRQAAGSDLEALLDLYQHFHRADGSSPEGVRQAWAQIMSHPGLFVYLGELDGQLVTSCTLVVVPNLRRGPRPYALMELVATHGEHRRRGYGTAILQHALASAWQMNCYKVMLLTGRTNEGVLQFYEGVGFSRDQKTGFAAPAPARHNSAQEPTAGFATVRPMATQLQGRNA
jgi:GNAT superfamily N-acetyltransferase